MAVRGVGEAALVGTAEAPAAVDVDEVALAPRGDTTAVILAAAVGVATPPTGDLEVLDVLAVGETVAPDGLQALTGRLGPARPQTTGETATTPVPLAAEGRPPSTVHVLGGVLGVVASLVAVLTDLAVAAVGRTVVTPLDAVLVAMNSRGTGLAVDARPAVLDVGRVRPATKTVQATALRVVSDTETPDGTVQVDASVQAAAPTVARRRRPFAVVGRPANGADVRVDAPRHAASGVGLLDHLIPMLGEAVAASETASPNKNSS